MTEDVEELLKKIDSVHLHIEKMEKRLMARVKKLDERIKRLEE